MVLEIGDPGWVVWPRIMKARYLCNKTLASVTVGFNDSPRWKSLLQVREAYFTRRKIILKSGDVTQFWRDPSGNGDPLGVQYPELFDICQQQECTTRYFVDRVSNLPSHRHLHARCRDQWDAILHLFDLVNPSDGPYNIVWSLNKTIDFHEICLWVPSKRDLWC